MPITIPTTVSGHQDPHTVSIAAATWRRALNERFGVGRWRLVPVEITVDPTARTMTYVGALRHDGQHLMFGMGTVPYDVNGAQISYATAAERAKALCLVTCCEAMNL